MSRHPDLRQRAMDIIFSGDAYTFAREFIEALERRGVVIKNESRQLSSGSQSASFLEKSLAVVSKPPSTMGIVQQWKTKLW